MSGEQCLLIASARNRRATSAASIPASSLRFRLPGRVSKEPEMVALPPAQMDFPAVFDFHAGTRLIADNAAPRETRKPSALFAADGGRTAGGAATVRFIPGRSQSSSQFRKYQSGSIKFTAF